jgi:site-specific DNA-cytosine methylase
MSKPLAIDLFCGLGGWAEGLLSEGWDVIGYDIEAHDYGTGGYSGTLILQDVTTLHGSQFKDAALIVASPPCQAYSYRVALVQLSVIAKTQNQRTQRMLRSAHRNARFTT